MLMVKPALAYLDVISRVAEQSALPLAAYNVSGEYSAVKAGAQLGWLDARAITTGNPDQLPELPEGTSPQDAAAWTIAARVILNLDEFVNKN